MNAGLSMKSGPRGGACRLGILTLLAALLMAVPGAGPARAAASGWSENEQGRVRLISAGETVGDTAGLRLGLHFELTEGWKIYWRSPGDAGYPPRLDWSASENLAAAELQWPVPHRFELFGLQTFGYGKEVVLPVRAEAKDPSKPVKLRAKVDYLTCAEICVPRQATLALDLPPGAAKPARHAFLIDQFRSRVPGEGAATGLDVERAVLTATGEQPVLGLAVTAAPPFQAPDAIVEGADGYAFGKPEVTLRDDGARAVLRLTAARGPGAEGELAGKTVTLTVIDGKRGLEREVTLEPGSLDAAGAAPARTDGTGGGGAVGWRAFAGMLGLAVLGGLILNLMPCVLPVLSLKLLSVVGQGGRAQAQVRASFLASAAGILFSFLALAGGAIALKAAGLAVGWGIQFQQPAFLVAMTLIVTLFACNLFGFFEIALPRAVADVAGGTGHDGHEGLAGHFLTGAFATLLATPCSAPFLGTAIAFALSRGVVEILAIFLALGVGLALPYLAVAAVPRVAAMLPRPGHWMITLRRILGVALAATGVWLLSVLAAQDGLVAAAALGALMLVLGVLFWRRQALHGGWRRAVPLFAVLIAAAAFAVPPGLGAAPDGKGEAVAAETDWAPLDEARIGRLVADGKVVFVDVTAEWCITCKVNKAAVIDSERVQAALDARDVVRMRGDWTQPSDRIADYLASFDRYGIPFNAVYGPGAPEGIALPEILSKSGVLEALSRARGDGGAA